MFIFGNHFFRIIGVQGNNLPPIKLSSGERKVKLDPGVILMGSCFIKYCTLFCIEPARFSINMVWSFSSNVN